MNKHRINIFIALVLAAHHHSRRSHVAYKPRHKEHRADRGARSRPRRSRRASFRPRPRLRPMERAASADPSASPSPSVQPGQTAAPQPTQQVINRTINQTGSFESNTGTKMIMYANWTATSQNSETVTIKLDVILSTYTLSVGPHNGVITVAGVDYSFTSPGISYKSEKVRNNAVLTSRSIEVTVPAGQATAIPVSVKWDFYGTYGGVEISRVSAGGTINIQG